MLSEPQAAELLSSLSTLLRTSRAISMKSHGASVTGTQIATLKVLSAGEVRMGDLAEKLMVAPSVASRVVATLEQEGLVQRHPDPADARACLLELSDLGRERLHERQRLSLALMRDVLVDWTDDEAATAARFMKRLDSRIPDFSARMLDQPELSHRSLTELAADQGGPLSTPEHSTPQHNDAQDDAVANHVIEMEHASA